jgi:hypothetical protein
MEPFFDFCGAVIYAAQQVRIEYRAWKSYRRNPSPRNADPEPALTGAPRFTTKAIL